MIRKALTYLTILSLTVLPVQLISAGVENLNMKMNMSQQAQSNSDCMHEMTEQRASTQSEQNTIDKSCCNEQSHDCQRCDNCPQVVSTMISPSYMKVKPSLLKISNFITAHSVLNGISQKNLLRPPRNFI